MHLAALGVPAPRMAHAPLTESATGGSGVHLSLLYLKAGWFTMSLQGLTGGPGVGEPYTVGHIG
jgi:hypothetical protein